jgi:hypothetical protein
MAFSWMGVGFSYPNASTACAKPSLRPKSKNGEVMADPLIHALSKMYHHNLISFTLTRINPLSRLLLNTSIKDFGQTSVKAGRAGGMLASL